jgi:hypothetical protein
MCGLEEAVRSERTTLRLNRAIKGKNGGEGATDARGADWLQVSPELSRQTNNRGKERKE